MLNNALDYGISEYDFWNMTLSELDRLIASKERVYKIQNKDKATHNYILASLIGKSISRLFSSGESYPDIYEVYPSIFSDEIDNKRRKKQEQRDQLSALRFKQFAQSYNKKFEGVAKDK